MVFDIDILEGTALSHDVLAGWEITRIAIVQGLRAIATVTLPGTTTSGSTTVTMASTTGVLIGMSLVGTGIPVPCKVISIITNTSIVISVAATASGSPSIVFGSLDTAGLAAAAEGATIAVTGDRGSLCPNVGVPTFLKTFKTDLIGDNAAKVSIVYKGYPLPTYEFDGGINQVESNKDASNTLITVAYTYPSDYPYNDNLRGKTITQMCLVNRIVTEKVITISFLITDGNISGTPATATEIMQWHWAFEGYCNNGSYTLGGITGAQRTWLVEKVHGISKDGGITYEASVTYHYKSNTWDKLVVFVDPATGLPPSDLVAGTGYKLVVVAPEASLPTYTFPPN